MLPEQLAEVRRWLRRAAEDLRAGAVVVAASPPLIEDALFHSQQAAEKAIKAFLTWHGRSFRKTHDLRELGGTALDLDATLEPLLRSAARLTPFAALFRYPVEMGEPNLDEAKEALATADQLYQAVLERLPAEAHP